MYHVFVLYVMYLVFQRYQNTDTDTRMEWNTNTDTDTSMSSHYDTGTDIKISIPIQIPEEY